MYLCLDVGNTTIHAGFFNGKKFKHYFRVNTKQGWSSDQFGVFIKGFCRENNIAIEGIKNVIVSSVVPSVDYHLRNAALKYFGVEPFFIRAGVKTGISLNKYNNPAEIGGDIICSLAAAAKLVENKHCVVVNMGTATTVTAINVKREFLGGMIMPGIKVQMESLAASAEKLFSVEIEKPQTVLGRSTIQCLQSGIYNAHYGAIKHMIESISHKYFGDEELEIIATGGYSRILQSTKLFTRIEPDLVLYGMLRIFELTIAKAV